MKNMKDKFQQLVDARMLIMKSCLAARSPCILLQLTHFIEARWLGVCGFSKLFLRATLSSIGQVNDGSFVLSFGRPYRNLRVPLTSYNGLKLGEFGGWGL